MDFEHINSLTYHFKRLFFFRKKVKAGNDNSTESKYAFVDFCDANPSINSHLKYYSTRGTNLDLTELSLSTSFESLNCTNEIEDVNDNKAWLNIPAFQNVFRCAKLKESLDSDCETTFVRQFILSICT